MINTNLAQFSHQALSSKETSTLKGGVNFCEWYVASCQEAGVAINQKIMSRLRKCDAYLNKNGYGSTVDRHENLLERIGYLSDD